MAVPLLSRHNAIGEKVVERLRGRQAELESAILARLGALASDPVGDRDPEYLDGRRALISAVVEGLLMALAEREDLDQSPPTAVLMQARRAAHNGVDLDVVLRRYILGYAVFWDFLLEEVGRTAGIAEPRIELLRDASLRQLSFYDRVIGRAAREYMLEVDRLTRTRAQHRADIVREILAGASHGADELGYDLDAVHIGLIVHGTGAESAVRHLAAELDCELLHISRGDESLWAWLGGARVPAGTQFKPLLSERPGVRVAAGEPASGIDGFRFTHRQAQSAQRVARHGREAVTLYADVAFLAVALDDDAIAGGLVDTYLAPLCERSDRGARLIETLRAYFSTGLNAASAAAKLGVNERTVSYRLKVVEDCLGYPVRERHAELSLALRLQGVLADGRPGRMGAGAPPPAA